MKKFCVLLVAHIFVTTVLCAKKGAEAGENTGSMGLPELPLGLGQQLGQLGLGGLGQQLGSTAGLGDALKSCKCKEKSEPVCASNGMTYNNECMFKCMMKVGSKSGATKNLKIMKKGKCTDKGSKSG